MGWGLVEILWTVTGVVVPLLLGTAWAMVGLTPPEFWIARGCIGLAALIFGATALIWLATSGWPNVARIFVGAVLGTISIVGFSEALRWVNARESLLAAQTTAAIDKRAAIRTQLQNFYIASGPILNRNLPKDMPAADFGKYIEEVNAWIFTTDAWIKDNLGDAAEARFQDVGGGFSFNWDRAINPAYNNAINILTKYRNNLATLIETGAWDQKQ